MECVERTQAVAKAMAEKNWDLAVQLRGRSFARNLETYKMLTRLKPPKESFDAEGRPVVSFFFWCEIEPHFFMGNGHNFTELVSI